MSGKAVLVGGAVVLAVVGGYWWMQQQKPIEANPEEVVLEEQAENPESVMETYGVPQDEGQQNTGMVMYGENSDVHDYVDSCPDMKDAVKLDFSDEMTEEIFTVVKDYEKKNHANEFIEEGETHLIDYIDLNNDGREDFVTLYNAKNWCGSIGCLTEVFIQQEDGSYHGGKLLYSRKDEVQVTNSVVNDYRQIIAKGDVSTPDGTNQLWTWDRDVNGYKRYGNCHKDAPTHDVVAPADMVDAPEENIMEEE